MGHVEFDAVIAVFNGYNKDGINQMVQFINSLDNQTLHTYLGVTVPPVVNRDWRNLIVGPVHSITNDYVTFAILPHGSKYGWEIQEAGDRFIVHFINLVKIWGGESVRVTFGADARHERGHPFITYEGPAEEE